LTSSPLLWRRVPTWGFGMSALGGGSSAFKPEAWAPRQAQQCGAGHDLAWGSGGTGGSGSSLHPPGHPLSRLEEQRRQFASSASKPRVTPATSPILSCALRCGRKRGSRCTVTGGSQQILVCIRDVATVRGGVNRVSILVEGLNV
jgi:hypothetical protein